MKIIKSGAVMKKIFSIILLLPHILLTTSNHTNPEHDSDTQTMMHMIDTTHNDISEDTFSSYPATRSALPPHKPMVQTWTQPLIIDANNAAFANSSTFKFENNIIYNPGTKYTYPATYSDYPAAIIVAKDNMTIDLNGFNLSLDPASASNFLTNNPTYGIAIYQGVKNLKIISSSGPSQQGSITGFSGFAIYGTGVAQTYNSYDIYLNYIKNLTIDNLLITQNMNGIYILNGVNTTITNTNIVYNFSSRAVFGIFLVNVLDGLIDTCKANQNYSFVDVTGFCLQDTSNITVQNSQANANRSYKSGNVNGFVVSGSLLGTLSSSNRVTNCIANRNLCSFVSGKKSVGFTINNKSHHNILENCISFYCGHVQAEGFAATFGIGFLLDDASFNQLHQNKSGYHDTYGYYDTATISSSFWTSNYGFFNTTANYNVTVPTSSGSAPLSTIVITPNDLNDYLGAGPILANISAELP